MKNKLHIVLYKDSNCDLCKTQQQEFINNPPCCDVTILHVKHGNGMIESIAKSFNITSFPTTILSKENGSQVYRWEGFVSSKIIDSKIKEYETKHLV